MNRNESIWKMMQQPFISLRQITLVYYINKQNTNTGITANLKVLILLGTIVMHED